MSWALCECSGILTSREDGEKAGKSKHFSLWFGKELFPLQQEYLWEA